MIIWSIIGPLVGVVVASVLAYLFWKREWAIQRETSERQERRRVQLALAERVTQIVTGLIHVMLVDPHRTPQERDGLIAELKAMSGPLQKFFSPASIEQYRRFEFEQRPINGESQKLVFVDRAHALIDAPYQEVFQ
jgi:hypothetical protein